MAPVMGPTTRSVRALFGTLRLLALTGWEMLVWGSVRAGSVSLAGMPRSFRLLIRAGLWLTILLLAMLLFSDTWRVVSPLVPLLADTQSLGGLYAPQWLVSFIIGLLALAWAYVLTGGLHSPWWCKALVLVLLGVFDAGLSITLITGALADLGLVVIGVTAGWWSLAALALHVLGWLALLAWFVVRWRRPARPGLEFPITLLLAMDLVFSSHFGTLLGNQTFQSQTGATALQLTNTLQAIGVFLTPFLVLSGVEVAEFGMTLTKEVTGRLARNQVSNGKWARRAWLAALVIFLLWRVVALWVAPLLGRTLQMGAGAIVAAVVLVVVFALRRRSPPVGELPAWALPVGAVTLYAALLVVQLLGFAEALGAVGALVLGLGTQAVTGFFDRFFLLLTGGNELFVGGLAVLFGLGLWIKALGRRQHLPAAALFAWIFGVWLIFWTFTRHGQPLGGLSFRYTDLETAMVPILLVGLVLAGVFRRLTGRALLHLTAAAVLLWLLESQSWLSDPLSPLGGLVGAPAIFISAGVLLNVLSAGNHFALNTEHRHFPRLSRSLLYFGYAILTVTTIVWLAATHSAGAIAHNNQIAQNGFIAIGLPLAIWALLTANPDLLGEGE